MEEDFQRCIKVCMEAKNLTENVPRKRPLKARLPDAYYGKSHMDCYQFCQQCEDHFDTAGARGPNRTPFAASFLRGCRHQHKRRLDNGLAPLTCPEFKAFL